MSTSAAWGVLATNSDAPEEATQRPPFLALRGPSHSHPAALLHRRRRITPWQASSPASSVPFPLGRGGIGRGPRGSIGTIGSFGSGSFGGRSFGGRSFSGRSAGGLNGPPGGLNGPQYAQGKGHHQGRSRMMNIPSHQQPSGVPSFGTCPSMWFSIWPLPALCPSSCITRPTLHPREDCVAWEIPYSYSP